MPHIMTLSTDPQAGPAARASTGQAEPSLSSVANPDGASKASDDKSGAISLNPDSKASPDPETTLEPRQKPSPASAQDPDATLKADNRPGLEAALRASPKTPQNAKLDAGPEADPSAGSSGKAAASKNAELGSGPGASIGAAAGAEASEASETMNKLKTSGSPEALTAPEAPKSSEASTISETSKSPSASAASEASETSEVSKAENSDPSKGLPDPVADFDPERPMAPDAPFNIASLLTLAAARHPDRLAVVTRRGADCLDRVALTYAELDRDSTIFAAALSRSGLDPGDRVIVMVPTGLDFFVVVFGLFKASLVPVMVDPGMGLKRMLRCLAEGRPRGLVGIKLAHLASFVLPRFFKTIKRRVTLGVALTRGTLSLRSELVKGALNPPEAPKPATVASDAAAVLFTSGATGPAKGAIYTHSMFMAQVGLIRHGFGMADGGVDLATFPLFSLFSSALGLTAVIPNMNPVKPGSADPWKIISAIEEEGATSLFASPALLSVLSSHAKETGTKLPGLTRVISAGAPVQPFLAASFTEALDPKAKLLTPYGATEAMPLTCIDAKEIAMVRGMTEQGFGMCVGKPLPGHEVVIIPITDQPLESFNPAKLMGAGEIGEITARGPVVSQGYFERPEETRLSLMKGPDGQIWRRMGDLGWRDAQGRIWFCGRKSQRVVTSQGTFFTICCEAVFNNHPKVRRSALVGVGVDTKPVVVVEPNSRISKKAWPAMVEELKALARTNPRTRTINTFLRKNSFPVDIRHNAKISREKLAVWATKMLAMPDNHKLT